MKGMKGKVMEVTGSIFLTEQLAQQGAEAWVQWKMLTMG